MTGGQTFRLSGVGVPRALCAHQPAGGADLLCGTLRIENGSVAGFSPDDGPVTRIVLPKLAEVHVHLDKCHSVDRLDHVGGDLAAAIAATRIDKTRWTAEDLAQRARRGLDELIAAGCGVVRSHVDWATGADQPEAPLAWEVLGDLTRDAAASGVVLQRAALTGIDEMADPAVAGIVARRIARDGGVLGSFLLDHSDRRAGLRTLLGLADRYGLALDFHVDEGLDPTLDGLERIADAAIAMRFEGPVLCGHACSLASQSASDVSRIADKLARAGIAVAALPSTNLYLQGRRDGTPDRRGITQLHALADHGVKTVIGTDNVRDAFCPIGRHDPVYALALGVLAGHLDPPFGHHLPKITTDARAALGLPPVYVDTAALDDLIAFPVRDLATLIAAPPPPIPLTQSEQAPHVP